MRTEEHWNSTRGYARCRAPLANFQSETSRLHHDKPSSDSSLNARDHPWPHSRNLLPLLRAQQQQPQRQVACGHAAGQPAQQQQQRAARHQHGCGRRVVGHPANVVPVPPAVPPLRPPLRQLQGEQVGEQGSQQQPAQQPQPGNPQRSI